MQSRPERKTITKRPDPDEPAQEQFGQRRRPEKGPYRLQVDSQTKESFALHEEAAAAGLAIKKAYPIVRVTVYDTVNSASTLIELPSSAP